MTAFPRSAGPWTKGAPVRRTLPRLLAATLALVGPMVLLAGPVEAGGSHALIQGSGSSWASNAVNQWIADVQSNGLQVVFTSSGSAQGRKDFGFKTTDYAVSDIGYQGTDPVTGDQDTSQGRGFGYLPVVAGGTAFPYQIKVGGQMVRNLRLTGPTLAKIFTNQITDWSDPAVTADNNGHALPSLAIIPVVHSEGSGSTAQFTRYMDTVTPGIWEPFFGQKGLTEYFPRKGQMIAQNGSDGVMNFLSSAAANGAIGYDEYSYALAKNYPVIKLGNAAGFFTAPTQYNVAVALTQAKINQDKTSKDYLLQDLNPVYADTDKRTYAMSSYSYMVIPTDAGDSRMTTSKRQTLADFLFYSVCQGQAEMGPIGYSPLPINLVQASFDQTAKLKDADPNVDLSNRDVTSCHNPTFVAGQPTRNYLAEIAPAPPACDQAGQGPCTGTEGLVNGNPTGDQPGGTAGGSTAGGAAASAGSSSSSGSGATGGTVPGQAGAPGTPAAGVGTTAMVDPITGQPVSAATGGGSADASLALGVPVTLAASRDGGLSGLLAAISVAQLLLLLAIPALMVRNANRRKGL